jgi:hypothetical protein
MKVLGLHVHAEFQRAECKPAESHSAEFHGAKCKGAKCNNFPNNNVPKCQTVNVIKCRMYQHDKLQQAEPVKMSYLPHPIGLLF